MYFYNAFNIILIVFPFPANFTIETEIKAFNIKNIFCLSSLEKTFFNLPAKFSALLTHKRTFN